jgi:hypothetical protein
VQDLSKKFAEGKASPSVSGEEPMNLTMRSKVTVHTATSAETVNESSPVQTVIPDEVETVIPPDVDHESDSREADVQMESEDSVDAPLSEARSSPTIQLENGDSMSNGEPPQTVSPSEGNICHSIFGALINILLILTETGNSIPVEYAESDFIWEDYLEETNSVAVPPTSFKHVHSPLLLHLNF